MTRERLGRAIGATAGVILTAAIAVVSVVGVSNTPNVPRDAVTYTAWLAVWAVLAELWILGARWWDYQTGPGGPRCWRTRGPREQQLRRILLPGGWVLSVFTAALAALTWLTVATTPDVRATTLLFVLLLSLFTSVSVANRLRERIRIHQDDQGSSTDGRWAGVWVTFRYAVLPVAVLLVVFVLAANTVWLTSQGDASNETRTAVAMTTGLLGFFALGWVARHGAGRARRMPKGAGAASAAVVVRQRTYLLVRIGSTNGLSRFSTMSGFEVGELDYAEPRDGDLFGAMAALIERRHSDQSTCCGAPTCAYLDAYAAARTESAFEENAIRLADELIALSPTQRDSFTSQVESGLDPWSALAWARLEASE